MAGLKLHSFCACGHLGQRHHEQKPHPCANPDCECAGYHHDTYHRPPDSWMHEGRRPRGRRRAGRYPFGED